MAEKADVYQAELRTMDAEMVSHERTANANILAFRLLFHLNCE